MAVSDRLPIPKRGSSDFINQSGLSERQFVRAKI